MMGYYEATRDFDYSDTDKMMTSIHNFYESNLKEEELSFDDGYLVGKLINILADNNKTEQLISSLSGELTGKRFSNVFGGDELISAFQSIRPELLKRYAEKTYEDYYDWFEK